MASRIMGELSEDDMAQQMTLQLEEDGKEYTGIYFDGYRPQRLFAKYGEDIKNVLHVYKCRASDDDPMGPPATIAPHDKSIVVNFAGTFLCEEEIPCGEGEMKLFDYNYD